MKFEYQRTTMMHERDMNKYGAEGWELVAVVQPTSFGLIMFWKRKIQDFKDVLTLADIHGSHGQG